MTPVRRDVYVSAQLCPILFGSTPRTVAFQAPLSMGFPRQEYWSGLSFSPPGDLTDPGIEPAYPASLKLAGGFFTISATWEAPGKQLWLPLLVTMTIDYQSYKSTPGYVSPNPGIPVRCQTVTVGTGVKWWKLSAEVPWWGVMKTHLVSKRVEDHRPPRCSWAKWARWLKERQVPSGHPSLVPLIHFIPPPIENK